MRIGFISTMAGDPWGGSEELWVQTAMLSLSKNHKVVASVYDWGPDHPKIAAFRQAGGIVLKRPRIAYHDSLKNKVRGKLREKISGYSDLHKIMRYKPDCLVISQGTINEIAFNSCIKFIRSLDIPYFIISQLNTEYNTIPLFQVEHLRQIFSKAKSVFFVSRRNLEVARRQFCLNFDNAIIINNPVNLEFRKRIAWPSGEVLQLAQVARLDSTVKGHGVLLEILSSQKWKQRKLKIRLYGSGKDEAYIKQLIVFYNLQDRVLLGGHVSDVAEIWSKNHVLLLPSTIEGMPLALIEAMVCGRPAVVSDVGGNAELIDDGITGFLAEAPSVASFDAAMERMWECRDKLEKMGLEAAERIKAKVVQNPCEALLESIVKHG